MMKLKLTTLMLTASINLAFGIRRLDDKPVIDASQLFIRSHFYHDHMYEFDEVTARMIAIMENKAHLK